MANEKEPQSYGSGGDWVTGNVGEEVNRLKGGPSSQHGDFYDSRRESETNAPEQGGKVSPEQIEENAQPGTAHDVAGKTPVHKVTGADSGAKRGGFFRDRDYK
jgi:hypothetical protein